MMGELASKSEGKQAERTAYFFRVLESRLPPESAVHIGEGLATSNNLIKKVPTGV